MGLAGALASIAGYIEALSAEPPYRLVRQGSLAQEPFGASETVRHFEIADDGLVQVIQAGYGLLPRIELRNISIIIKYSYDGDYLTLEGQVATDREAIVAALTSPLTYASSSSIEAILLEVSSSIDRDKEDGVFLVTLGFKVHVRY